jgi:DNA-directed RNA polymerase specialized sigma24 family protein
MSTTTSQDLDGYNRLVLQFQDRAYTFAVYLLGDTPQAGQLVQEAFQDCFSAWRRSSLDFEICLLRCLLKRCPRSGSILGPGPLNRLFNILERDGKLALILVDCLDCSCSQAAAILNWSLPRLQKTLAQARLKLSALLPQTQSIQRTHVS